MLDREGIEWKAFDPAIEGDRDERLLHGDYTEDILRDAGIGSADALVAGADIDAVNLGVTTLARRVKPDIFVMIRQNHMQDRALVEAARADVTFVQSDLMVHECLQLLKTPMLGRFIALLRDAEPGVAAATIQRVREEVGDGAPSAWTFECDVMEPGCSPRSSRTRRSRSGSPTCWRIRPIPQVALARRGADAGAPGHASSSCPTSNCRSSRATGYCSWATGPPARLQQRYLTEPGTVSWVLSGAEPPSGISSAGGGGAFAGPERPARPDLRSSCDSRCASSSPCCSRSAAFAYIAVLVADTLMQRWFVRDLDMRST